jgi:hypothetical protein
MNNAIEVRGGAPQLPHEIFPGLPLFEVNRKQGDLMKAGSLKTICHGS